MVVVRCHYHRGVTLISLLVLFQIVVLMGSLVALIWIPTSPAMDGDLALVIGKARILGGGLYPCDPRVLIGTFLMALFFAFEFDGRVWALAMSLNGGSLLLLWPLELLEWEGELLVFKLSELVLLMAELEEDEELDC